jgi:hypothetical protein
MSQFGCSDRRRHPNPTEGCTRVRLPTSRDRSRPPGSQPSVSLAAPGVRSDESAASTATGCHSSAAPSGAAIARISTLHSAISRPSFVTALSNTIATAGVRLTLSARVRFEDVPNRRATLADGPAVGCSRGLRAGTPRLRQAWSSSSTGFGSKALASSRRPARRRWQPPGTATSELTNPCAIAPGWPRATAPWSEAWTEPPA